MTSGGLGHELPRVHLLQGKHSPGAGAHFVAERQPSKYYETKTRKTEYAEVDFKRFSSRRYLRGMKRGRTCAAMHRETKLPEREK